MAVTIIFFDMVSAIDDKREEIGMESLKNLTVGHLSSLSERFQFYFPKEQDPENKLRG